MKKRIISLILVLVIFSLSLVSCGYSMAKDDLSPYATFSAEAKAAFEKALLELEIEDGDFTADEETRNKKVVDAIYEALASAAKNDGDKVATGTIGAHDLVNYCYYTTVTIDGVEYVFNTAKMSTSSTTSIQLGLLAPEGLDAAISEKLAGIELDGKSYSTTTSGTVSKGDVVFISYTSSEQVEVIDKATGEVEKDADGNPVTEEKKVTVTKERLVLTEGASDFVDFLIEKKASIGSTIDFTDYKGSDGKTYTSVKIEWVANGNELAVVDDVTYDESKTDLKDVYGNAIPDLKDKTISYHIYPVNYIAVSEFTATTLVDLILGDDITVDSLASILIKGYDDMEDADKETALKAYDKTTGDKTVTLKEMAEAIANAQATLADKEEALETPEKNYDSTLEDFEKVASDKVKAAKDELDAKQAEYDAAKTIVDAAGDAATDEQKAALEAAKTALDAADKALDDAIEADISEATANKTTKQNEYDAANKVVTDAGDAATDEQKKALTEAEKALESATTALKNANSAKSTLALLEAAEKTYNTAQSEYNDALATKNAKVKELLTWKDGMESELVEGYKRLTKESLIKEYNEELRMNLAKAVYELLEESIEVTGAPQKALDLAYDQLIQNYQYDFYNGTADSDAGVSNYKQYKTFKNFLIAQTKVDLKSSVSTYEDACSAVGEKSMEIVKPLVRIYVAAQAYDLIVTDKEFKEYKKDVENGYSQNEYYYGENSVRHAYQFDKLMNYILEYEEQEDGSYKYVRVDSELVAGPTDTAS